MDDKSAAELKTQVSMLIAAVERMERLVGVVAAVDRTVGLLELKQEHTSDALLHIRERMEQQSIACLRADEVVHKRVDDFVLTTTTFQSRATGGFYAICAMGTVVVAVCTWALAQITRNTEANIEQTQKIASLERAVSEVRTRLYLPQKGQVEP